MVSQKVGLSQMEILIEIVRDNGQPRIVRRRFASIQRCSPVAEHLGGHPYCNGRGLERFLTLPGQTVPPKCTLYNAGTPRIRTHRQHRSDLLFFAPAIIKYESIYKKI